MILLAQFSVEGGFGFIDPRCHLRIGERPALFLDDGNTALRIIEQPMPFLQHVRQQALCLLRVFGAQRPVHGLAAKDGLNVQRDGNLRVIGRAAPFDM
nr:hypothetical protein [Pseudaminobacter manganicus]